MIRRFYRNFSEIEKGGLCPLLVAQFLFLTRLSGILTSLAYAAATFFLPTNLPTNGQNRSNNARDVIAPTK
jgi:hypothetical protein